MEEIHLNHHPLIEEELLLLHKVKSPLVKIENSLVNTDKRKVINQLNSRTLKLSLLNSEASSQLPNSSSKPAALNPSKRSIRPL